MNAGRDHIRYLPTELTLAEQLNASCWRGMIKHMEGCAICAKAYQDGLRLCVGCDVGLMVRGEWQVAVARVVELRHLAKLRASAPAHGGGQVRRMGGAA